jgi:large subunit ribosomal protein L14e
MPKRANAIEIGRVCLINRGPDNGKICTIIDVVDQNRALVDGPADVTGIHRQTISFRALALTPIVVSVTRNARPKTLRAAVQKQKVVEQWETSNWAAKLKAQKVKQSLSDFDRFRNMVAHKKRATAVGRELAKLKKVPQPKRKVKKSVVKKAEIARKEAEVKKKELEKARAEEKKRIEKDKADKANAKGKDGKKAGEEAAPAKKKK